MKEGEVQLFRIVNAAQQGEMPFTGLPADSFRQIAQDGVQFTAENYDRQPLTTKISMFPGNRMDLLVKAPPKGTTYQLKVNTNTILATVKSVPSTDPPMDFPPTKGYPIRFPNFLADIPESEIRKSRRLTFGWDTSKGGNPNAQPKGTQRNPTTNAPPHFTIDGKQFDHAVIDQTMELNDCEEWKVENTTTIPHPFHIHVNPFQVIEVFDPGASPDPIKLPAPYVWWDVFAIPPNGYFKMRSRFADFTGKFVIHCHILGHEDRGMMQVVEVIPQRKLNVPHH
jgi:FtsP/CotA-like multicopper oxidase with cupredoxin domain